MWAYNFLRTKYFHEVSPASLHAYSLKSRYGIVSRPREAAGALIAAPQHGAEAIHPNA
jgi:hypothetical protein